MTGPYQRIGWLSTNKLVETQIIYKGMILRHKFRGAEMNRLACVLGIGFLSISLSGCAEMAARRAAAAAAQNAANEAADDQVCRSYGATPGSQAYFSCRMNAENRRVMVANADAQRQAAASAALLQAGTAMMAQPSQAPVVTCNSQPVGTTVFTSCR